MTTVAEFSLPAEEFPLGAVFSAHPDVTVELERLVPGPSGAVPYFWVRDARADSVAEHFSGHPGVSDVRTVDTTESAYLMRWQWSPDYDCVLDALVGSDVVMLEAAGTSEAWTFEVRAETRESIADFRNFCHDSGKPVSLTRLHGPSAPATRADVTEKQFEALSLALERGYFHSPRRTTLDEIASVLGISKQALASRIRRGTRHLVEQAQKESAR